MELERDKESCRVRSPWGVVEAMTLSSVLSAVAEWQPSSMALTYYIPG